jgi:hypothetical protein
MHPNSRSFTVRAHGGVLRVLITDCGIASSFDISVGIPATGPPGLKNFKAIWDTGATGCLITQAVVDACALKPTGMTVAHGLNSSQDCETYLICLSLPNFIVFPGVKVIKGILPPGGPDVLIGMDVITAGDFSLTNKGGSTVFSFRIPSELSTDFVQEHQRLASLGVNHGGVARPPRPGKKFGKHKRHK